MSQATSLRRILETLRAVNLAVDVPAFAGAYCGPGHVGLWRASHRIAGVCGVREDPEGDEFVCAAGLVPGDCEDLNGVQLQVLADLAYVQAWPIAIGGSSFGHIALETEIGVFDAFEVDEAAERRLME